MVRMVVLIYISHFTVGKGDLWHGGRWWFLPKSFEKFVCFLYAHFFQFQIHWKFLLNTNYTFPCVACVLGLSSYGPCYFVEQCPLCACTSPCFSMAYGNGPPHMGPAHIHFLLPFQNVKPLFLTCFFNLFLYFFSRFFHIIFYYILSILF